MKRSLYQCGEARIKNKEIYCHVGKALINTSETGNIPISKLAEGKPLVIAKCQTCPYFDDMGPPVPPRERGWLRMNWLNK